MTADAPEPFRIEVEPHRATIVVAPHGDIDIATAEPLQGKLREVMEAGFRRVVLDLRAVSFLDSTGLRVVLTTRAAAAATDAEVEFALIPGPEPVQRLFDVTGTAAILRFLEPEAIDH